MVSREVETQRYAAANKAARSKEFKEAADKSKKAGFTSAAIGPTDDIPMMGMAVIRKDLDPERALNLTRKARQLLAEKLAERDSPFKLKRGQ